MALSRDIVIRLLGDADSAVKAQKAAADAAEVSVGAYRRAEREYDKQQKAMETASRKQRAAMQDVGQVAVGFGTAMAAGLGMAVKASMDWESSWAGVTKTVSGSDAELAAVEKGLRDLTAVLPASHTEIAAVAEAAGQLGVQTSSVVEFTRTMVNLGETTNLTADEAATSLAQLMNVMGTAPEDVGRLGAALVALGNDGASTEADIVRMASYLSGAAALIGASESDVLALANSLTSMGINAERGGGVMTRVMQDIYSAVQMGGDQLAGFAEVAGMSSEEFARAFEADPIRAIGAFTDGLAAAKGSGDNVVAMLNDLGYKGTQDTAVLLQMASAQGLLTENLDLGNLAWEQNTALVEEAAKRYDTTEAKVAMARNSLTEAGIEIGEVLLPVLASVAEGVADVATWFADLPGPVKDVLGVLGTVASVAGLAGGAFLLLAPRVADTFRSFRDLQTTMPGVSDGLGKVGKAAGIASVVAGLSYAVGGLVEAMGPAPLTMEETTAALLGMGESMESVNAIFQHSGGDVWAADIDGLADAARQLTDPGLIDRLDDFGGSLTSIVTFGGLGSSDGRPERAAMIDDLGRMGDALGLMVTNGNAELAATQFEQLAAEWEKGGGTVEQLMELMPGYETALQGVENEQKLAAESATGAAGAVDGLTGSLEGVEGAAGSVVAGAELIVGAANMTEDQLEEAQKALEDWKGQLQTVAESFVDPLAAYKGLLDEKTEAERASAEETARVRNEEIDKEIEAVRRRSDAEIAGVEGTTAAASETRTQMEAQRDATVENLEASKVSWEDYVGDVSVSLDEWAAKLREQIENQENWRQNVVEITERGGLEIGQIFHDMGVEGAAETAAMAAATEEDFQVMKDALIREAQLAGNGATDELGKALKIAEIVARDGSRATARAIASELNIGVGEVERIANGYGIAVADGVNPILQGLGKPKITVSANRVGGGSFADGGYTGPGGKYDPAGIVHAGEYVLTKEQTSRLGINRIEEFANRGYATGGFVTSADVPRPRSTAPFGPPFSTAADAAMEKIYNETVAWLNANVLTGGAIGGGGSLAGGGGMVQRLFNTIRAAFPRAKLNSGLRPGDPGYHGLGRAVDLGESGFAGGAGRPYLGDMAAWIYGNHGAQTKELIYTGAYDRTPDLKNGRVLNYGAATNAAHRNHVHWAMANGGIIGEPVLGRGLRTGASYSFGERGPETVLPGVAVGSSTGASAGGLDVRKLGEAIAAALPTTIGNVTFPPSDGRTATEAIGELVHAINVYDRGGKYAGAR